MIFPVFSVAAVLLSVLVPGLDIDPSVIGAGLEGGGVVSSRVGAGLFSDEAQGLSDAVRQRRDQAAAVRFDGFFNEVIVLEAVDPAAAVESRVAESGAFSGSPTSLTRHAPAAGDDGGLSSSLVVGVLGGSVVVGGGIAWVVARSRMAAREQAAEGVV